MEGKKKDWIDKLKEEWVVDVRKWEVERDAAKYEQRKPRWTKPKMPSMEKAIVKPKISDFEMENTDDEDNEDKDGEGSEGGDSD